MRWAVPTLILLTANTSAAPHAPDAPNAPGFFPLDPLSAAEIEAAAKLVRAAPQFPAGAFFSTIVLSEPAKSEVLAFKPGTPITRRAFAIVLDRRGNHTFEAVADLTADRVTSWTEITSGQPPVLAGEYDEVSRIVKADPGWQAAIKKRGVTDLATVQVDTWAVGQVAGRQPSARLMRAVSYLKEGQTNFYGRPIEGVVALVNMNTGRLVKLVDTGVVPIPPPSQEFDEQSTGTRIAPKRLAISQPAGPTFVITGQEIRWQKWRFRYTLHPREGLILHTVGYEDGDRVRATVYEGADRLGGRIFTTSNLLAGGLITELGGEFIDTGHTEMLALVDEFGLERLDTQDIGALKPETYFVNGLHYTQAEAARAFVPLARQILEDSASIGDVVNYETEGGGSALDKMSIAQYFDKIGATGWIRELLDVAYVTEHGLDSAEQSALNFIFLIATGNLKDTSAAALLGESDERYKIRGGNQRLIDELAKRLDPQIQRRHRLEAIRSRGAGYTLTFQTDNGAHDEDADVVVLAVPFTMLREIKIDVELPALKKKAIAELGYGANAKVMIGFHSRPWQTLGYSGATYSDQPFQLAWDSSSQQPPAAGGLTLYSGGKLAIEAGQGSAEEAATRLMRGVERAYPGATKVRNGKVSRFHWPTFAWSKGSYACYKPGQWTTIAGAEGLPVGNLFFAGEHCSYDFQGYMNGAAQSGADTARLVMSKVSAS